MTVKILVVDDEPLLEYVIQQHFRQQIRAKEFEFIFAQNGQQALDFLGTNLLDLVLTDINMPEIDGLTLLAKLPEVDDTLKAIVVSAYGDLANIRTAMNRGAFDFLTKPLDFQDMQRTIQRALVTVQQTRDRLSQLQQVQIQLIQNEKMASIGEMITGIAHEINNPVGSLASNLDCAQTYFSNLLRILKLYQKYTDREIAEIQTAIAEIDLPFLLEDFPQLLQTMTEGTEQIRDLSVSLRTLARRDTDAKIPFQIHDGIDSTLRILKHRLKASDRRPAIQILKYYGTLPEIQCYPGQLNQVFMNIFANAIDAMEELETTRTRTEMQANPSQIEIRTLIPDGGTIVEIHIADNGLGMTAAVKQKMFDHLFTTKPAGKGTGLGLAIARQIVEEKHGGQLSCISSPGVGTEFIIAIPL